MKNRKISCKMAVMLFVSIFALTGCGAAKSDKVTEGVIERLGIEESGKAAYEASMEDMEQTPVNYPENWEEKQYASLNTMLLELNSGKLSYFCVPLCTGDYLTRNDASLSEIKGAAQFEYRMATKPEETDLYNKLNDALFELKFDGTMAELIEDYITNNTGVMIENEQVTVEGAPTYRIGITGDFPPFDYVSADGVPTGFNIALINALSERAGINFEIIQVEAAARTTALASDKIDCIFWLQNFCMDGYVPESEELALTDTYFMDHNCYVTKEYPITSISEIYGLQMD